MLARICWSCCATVLYGGAEVTTFCEGKRAAWRKRAGRQPVNLKGRLAAELT